MARRSVSTFWHGGAISNYEKACLLSFAGRGFEVVLYSFAKIPNLPSAIQNRDAAEIEDGALLHSFIYQGKPNIQHYSDLFRMQLLAKAETTWIDADVVLLDADKFSEPDFVIGKEDDAIVCNAVLRVPLGDPLVESVVTEIRGMTGSELPWGQTGHVILMKYVRQLDRQHDLTDAATLYPIHWSEFWKPFLPEFAAECEQLCSEAASLHLWSNLIVQMGVYKKIGPPEGSFLHSAFARTEAISAFDDFYPAHTMYRIVENWVARDGDDLGMKRVFRLLRSSVVNTYRRKIRRDQRPFLSKRPSKSPLAHVQAGSAGHARARSEASEHSHGK